jgi:hypothetical protein
MSNQKAWTCDSSSACGKVIDLDCFECAGVWNWNTGLFKMIVGVLTTCHTQYTWDRSIYIFLFNRTTLSSFVTYLTGALYVHLTGALCVHLTGALCVHLTGALCVRLTGALYVLPLWFYKHQHDDWVRSKHNAFSLPFATILVNCAPSGEMHNYCVPHIIKENFENFLIHRCNYRLLSEVYCVWQVVKIPTLILNNPVVCQPNK